MKRYLVDTVGTSERNLGTLFGWTDDDSSEADDGSVARIAQKRIELPPFLYVAIRKAHNLSKNKKAYLQEDPEGVIPHESLELSTVVKDAMKEKDLLQEWLKEIPVNYPRLKRVIPLQMTLVKKEGSSAGSYKLIKPVIGESDKPVDSNGPGKGYETVDAQQPILRFRRFPSTMSQVKEMSPKELMEDKILEKQLDNAKLPWKRLEFDDEGEKVEKYQGVYWIPSVKLYEARRPGMSENRNKYSGGYFDDEKDAAKASDNLSKALSHKYDFDESKLNFPEKISPEDQALLAKKEQAENDLKAKKAELVELELDAAKKYKELNKTIAGDPSIDQKKAEADAAKEKVTKAKEAIKALEDDMASMIPTFNNRDAWVPSEKWDGVYKTKDGVWEGKEFKKDESSWVGVPKDEEDDIKFYTTSEDEAAMWLNFRNKVRGEKPTNPEIESRPQTFFLRRIGSHVGDLPNETIESFGDVLRKKKIDYDKLKKKYLPATYLIKREVRDVIFDPEDGEDFRRPFVRRMKPDPMLRGHIWPKPCTDDMRPGNKPKDKAMSRELGQLPCPETHALPTPKTEWDELALRRLEENENADEKTLGFDSNVVMGVEIGVMIGINVFLLYVMLK